MPSEYQVYRCTFERIGRNRSVEPQEFAASDAENLAHVIWQFSRRYLASRDVEVMVDLEKGHGRIFAGLHTAGSFDIESVA